MANCGYPLDWFVEPIDSNLKCGICSGVLRDPRSTSCGHVYCGQCLYSWVASHGLCPQHCMSVDVVSLKRCNNIQTLISGLLVHCKNKSAGCKVQVPLAEKYRHGKSCPYRNSKFKLSGSFSLPPADNEYSGNPLRKLSNTSLPSLTRITAVKRSPSASSLRKSAASPFAVSRSRHMPVTMSSKGTFSTCTFKLKRTRPKEPLGLVLVSGDKTPEGRPRSFYVKKVHPDTLGWRAGLQSQDRIIQVDLHDLTSINPQEAIARIKEKTQVTLTVLRGLEPLHQKKGSEEHIYDEILYTDCQLSQNLSQQDENTPSNMAFTGLPPKSRGRSPVLEESQNHKSRQPATVHLKPVQWGMASKRPQSGERGSKDSGLSSGSSTHQDNEEKHGPPDSNQGLKASQCPGTSEHCRIEGNYEVEDIYLQKNGTSQLGITLGYDTRSVTGQLYVCEVLPNGLAAQHGRIKSGDIIRRVNGFEVHDPEEAILLFLEQDQDITLTVARPTKVISGHRAPPPPKITTTTHPVHCLEEPTYAELEPTVVRRVDSCGSLDSRNHHMLSDKELHGPSMRNYSSEMRRTKSASSTSRTPGRRDPINGISSPAALRQPSPLVNAHQPAYQPTYHVLTQPGSPQLPSQPMYHVLTQPGSPNPPPLSLTPPTPSSPTYQVLQQPGSPKPSLSNSPTPSNEATYHVLRQSGSPTLPLEEVRQISAKASSKLKRGPPPPLGPPPSLGTNAIRGSFQQLTQRLASTTPHRRHQIHHRSLSPPSPVQPRSSCRSVSPSSPINPPQDLHSIDNKPNYLRCETIPADFFFSRAESLV